MSFDGPVSVPVSAKKAKKPDWTGLPSTNRGEDETTNQQQRRSISSTQISSIINRSKENKHVHTICHRTKSMARHTQFKNILPQENCTKKRRTIPNRRSLRTSDLQTETTRNMENTQCIPCNLTTTICRKRSTWRKFSTPITRINGRRRSLRSRIYHQTLTTRSRIPILYQMERLSHHRSNVGKRISVFQRWKHVATI